MRPAERTRNPASTGCLPSGGTDDRSSVYPFWVTLNWRDRLIETRQVASVFARKERATLLWIAALTAGCVLMAGLLRDSGYKLPPWWQFIALALVTAVTERQSVRVATQRRDLGCVPTFRVRRCGVWPAYCARRRGRRKCPGFPPALLAVGDLHSGSGSYRWGYGPAGGAGAVWATVIRGRDTCDRGGRYRKCDRGWALQHFYVARTAIGTSHGLHPLSRTIRPFVLAALRATCRVDGLRVRALFILDGGYVPRADSRFATCRASVPAPARCLREAR